jgi:hypothetical protein
VLPACVQVSLLLNAMVPSGFLGDPWFAHRGMCGMFLCIVVGLLQTRGLQAYNVAPMAQLVQDVALAIYPVTGSDDPVPLLSVDINAVASGLKNLFAEHAKSEQTVLFGFVPFSFHFRSPLFVFVPTS